MTHIRGSLPRIAAFNLYAGFVFGVMSCAGGTDLVNAPSGTDSTALDPKRWQNGRTVASVSINPDTLTMNVGQTLVLSAIALNARGGTINGYPVAWTSSNPASATVNDTGVVTGLKGGTTTVSATINGVTDSASVTVVPTMPGTVTDLKVSVVGDTSATLTFTEVGDGNGNAASIDVRFAPTPINWGSAPSVKNGSCTTPVAGTTVGAALTCTVGGLTALTTYDFRVVAFRGTMYANAVYGPLSNVATATATAPVAVTPPSPGTVSDLRIAATTDTSATLSFTQVTDGLGGAAKYDVRVAASPIAWGSAQSVTRGTCSTPLAGTIAGNTLNCTVLGLTANTAYQFQLVPYRGTLYVDAVFGGLSNVASATTALASVASVTVSPATGTLLVGGTLALSAVARDVHGNTISGLPTRWSSADATVASVDAAGVALGVSSGTVAGTATIGGVSGSAFLTVAPSASQGGSATYPNKPAGLTVLGSFGGSPRETANHAFGFSWMSPWYWDPSRTEDDALIVTSDATNPTGSGYALRFNWKSALDVNALKAAKTDPSVFPNGPYSTLYIMCRMYWEPSWLTGGHKFFYIGNGNLAEHSKAAIATREPDGGRGGIINVGATGLNIVEIPNGTFKDGVWQNIEWVFIAESTPGAKDGSLYWYLDGRLIGSSVGNVDWGGGKFGDFEWYGTSNVQDQDRHYRIGELYMAGK